MLTLPALIPVSQSKAILGIPRSTAYRLAAEGRLTFKKIASTTYITGESARALIEALPAAALRVAKDAAADARAGRGAA